MQVYNNNNKCISNAPDPSMTTFMTLKVLYMKHYNNMQPDLIMHYISHSTPTPPWHPHTHTHTYVCTVLQPLASPSLSQSLTARFNHYIKEALFCCEFWLLRAQPCWSSFYQWRAEKGWFQMLLILFARLESSLVQGVTGTNGLVQYGRRKRKLHQIDPQ